MGEILYFFLLWLCPNSVETLLFCSTDCNPSTVDNGEDGVKWQKVYLRISRKMFFGMMWCHVYTGRDCCNEIYLVEVVVEDSRHYDP